MGRFNRDSHSGGDSRGPREFPKRDFGPRNFGGDRGFSSGGRPGGRPMMHQAVCSQCGKDCEVPFKPTGSRPIFCSTCFEQQGGGSTIRSSNSNYSRSSFRKPSFGGDRQMFEAVCGKCGEKCEVPFQPTPGKPVFCDNCFEKGGSTGGRNTEHYKEQFDIINAKLEKIMTALNIKDFKPEVVEKVAKVVVEKKAVVVEDKVKKSKKTAVKAKTVAKKAVAKKKK